MKPWLEAKLAAVSGKSKLAEAIRYALSRWAGLTRYLDDGRIEIDNNVVERAMRPIALGRKNHLFAGSDEGGRYWAIHASLIETCKMNDVDPQAWLADVLDKTGCKERGVQSLGFNCTFNVANGPQTILVLPDINFSGHKKANVEIETVMCVEHCELLSAPPNP